MSGSALRAQIAAGSLLAMPGVYDALSALLAERAGFKSVFLSGSALSFAQLGRPDLGLLSATELVLACERIAERVSIPVFVDADSGYGSIANLARLVGQLERAGAAGVQIEDQEPVKPADALASRPVIATGAMVGKIKAAQDARRDPSLVISARTDAAFTLGPEEAIARAVAFVEAGADVIFVEGLKSRPDIEALSAAVGGRTPLLFNWLDQAAIALAPPDWLSSLGFRIGLLPGLAVQAAAAGAQSALAAGAADPAAGLAHLAGLDFPMAEVVGAQALLARFRTGAG